MLLDRQAGQVSDRHSRDLLLTSDTCSLLVLQHNKRIKRRNLSNTGCRAPAGLAPRAGPQGPLSDHHAAANQLLTQRSTTQHALSLTHASQHVDAIHPDKHHPSTHTCLQTHTHTHTSPLPCHRCCSRARCCCRDLLLLSRIHPVHSLAGHPRPDASTCQLCRPVPRCSRPTGNTLPRLTEGDRGLDLKCGSNSRRQLQQGDTQVCHILSRDLSLMSTASASSNQTTTRQQQQTVNGSSSSRQSAGGTQTPAATPEA